MGYLSNPAQFARCQSAYDNMSPPDEYCPDCGREASCDCICDGSATAEELEDAALELEIDRIEYYKGDDMMNMSEAKKRLKEIVGEEYHTVRMEITETTPGKIRSECELYVNGMGTRFSATTWEDAFEKLAAAKKLTDEEIYEMAA